MRREWRCMCCGKLLGVVEGARLNVRFARGHQYIVGFPAEATCRSCQTLNELSGETRGTALESADSR